MSRRGASAHPRDLVRPSWRGWLHTVAFPLSIASGVVLVTLARPGRPRFAVAVYAVTVALLFGTSALYHRFRWSERAKELLGRLDHSMIFVFIAGTYTPMALLILPDTTARTVLAVAWGGAAVGITTRILWLHAPRWATVPLYLGLGWIAVFLLPDIRRGGGVAALVLIIAGGLLYSAGAVVYALRRPNPAPRTFGYHEVFHACTIAAASCHYVAVFLSLYAARLAV